MVAKEYLQGSLANIRNNIQQSRLQILDQINNTLNDAKVKSFSHPLDKMEQVMVNNVKF
jgi:hypothetical protein